MVRDLGFHDMNLFTKQAVEQGIVPGPRLKVTGCRDHPDGWPHLLGVP